MAGPTAGNDLYQATAGEQAQLGYVLKLFGMNFDLSSLLKNDTDADGDTLEIVSAEGQALVDGEVTVTGSAGGEFRILSDGSFYFDSTTGFEDLAAGETRDTVVTYTVSDGTSTTTATVTVTVTGVDGDSIFAYDDDFVTDENTALSGLNVTTNDVLYDEAASIVDVNGDPLKVGQQVSGSNGGLFTLNADGTFAFDPNSEFEHLGDGESISTSISYTYEAANGDVSSATVNVLVNGVNDDPVTGDDSLATPNFLGETYQISADYVENMGYTHIVTTEGGETPLGLGLLANDKDVDDRDLEIVAVNGQSLVDGEITVTGDNGALFIIKSDGTLDVDASTGFELLLSGQSVDTSVTYTVSDGTVIGDATVTVRVYGRNGDAISRADDFYSGVMQNDSLSGASGELFLNNWSFDNTFNVQSSKVGQVLSGSNGGEFILGADGSFTFDTAGDFLHLAEGQTTTTTVYYRIANDLGETPYYYSSPYSERLTVEVTGVNDAATANDDSYQINAGEVEVLAKLETLSNGAVVNATVLLNDSDIDRDPLSVIALNGQSLVSGELTVSGDNGGLFTLTENGTLTFDATGGGVDALNEGETITTTVTYTISDGKGSTDDAQISVEVTGINDAPVAADDDLGIVYRGGNMVFTINDLLANDYDPDNGSSISFNSVTEGAKGSLTQNGTQLVWDTNDEFAYLGDGVQEAATFTYTIKDELGLISNVGTVTITVDGTNVDPVAADDLIYKINADESKTLAQVTPIAGTTKTVDLTLVGNDQDGNNDVLVVTELNGQALVGGTLTIAGDNGGLFTVLEDGTMSFDATTGDFDLLRKGSSITSSIEYTVSDQYGGFDTGLVSVKINGVVDNTPVDAVDDEETVAAGTTGPITIDVLANDEDPNIGDTFSISSINTSGLVGDLVDNGDGTFDYTVNNGPNALAEGEQGQTSFTYTIEGIDGTFDTATVTINYTGVNDAPEAVLDEVSVSADATLSILVADLLANDTDTDNGSVISFVGLGDVSGVQGLLIDNSDGTLSYDPNGQFEALALGETAIESFEYVIQDELGLQSTGTVEITVVGINEAPVAVADDALSVNIGADLTIDAATLLANDTDADNGAILSILGFDAPSTGSVVDNGDGTFTFSTDDDLAMAQNESFTTTLSYTIQDEHGATTSATLDVVVNGMNDAPVATNNGGFIVAEDGILVIDIAAELMFDDTDPDNGAILSFDSFNTSGAGTYGSVSYNDVDGTLTYDPNGYFDYLAANEDGVDTFFYTITDEFGATDTAAVNIQITGVDDPIV